MMNTLRFTIMTIGMGLLVASCATAQTNSLDTNQDGRVDAADLCRVTGAWGGPKSDPADINSDGFVDSPDYLGILQGFSGDPGPVGAGTARAEYRAATGDLLISASGLSPFTLNVYVESLSSRIVGTAPDFGLPNSLITFNPFRAGITLPLARFGDGVTNLNFNIGPGIPMEDLTLHNGQSLGVPCQVTPAAIGGEFNYIVPEMGSSTMALMGYALLVVRRSRKRVPIQPV